MTADGATIIWVWQDGVYVLRRSAPRVASGPRWRVSGKGGVVHVVAFGDGLLAVGQGDGWLEIHRLETGDSLWKNGHSGTWELRPVGPFLTARSPTAALLVVDTRHTPAVRSWQRRLPADALSYAVSLPDRLAVGTRSATVQWLPLDPETAGPRAMVDAPGAVGALAFYGDAGVVVGGDFRGLHLLEPGRPSQELVPQVVGTDSLLTWQSRVVSVTDEGLTAWTLGSASELTVAGLVSLALGFVAAVGFVSIHLVRRRRAARGQVERATAPSASLASLAPEPAAVHWDVPSPPEKLVSACRRGECVLYAGAGLSAQAGLPTWRPFLEGLLERAIQVRVLTEDTAASLRSGLQEGVTDPVADSLVNAFRAKPDEFLEYLRSVFLAPAAPPTVAHRCLRDLRLCGAVTTNFDGLLERTFAERTAAVHTPRDAEALFEALAKRTFFLLKLYGTLERPETVVAAPAAFAELLAKNQPFASFMEGVFVGRTLLFLGTSLEGIETYLNTLTPKEHLTRPHYAVVAVTGTAWQARAELLQRRFGIEVLPYSPTDRHPELAAFLGALVRAVRGETQEEAPTSVHVDEEAGGPRPVRRLQLHNIGPFTDFALDLTPGWTVLLGDNGVGKSNILRAIALAVCGRDAEAYAGRLIRAGEPSATVVLETADSTYRAEIKRTSDGGASVTVVPARPLELEGWLVLGFPPLRSVSWDRPKGPTTEGRRRPGADDVLPLITGAPDPRLDSLKQWLVNLDARINYEASHASADPRYGQLLHRFFDVVNRVTPGLRLEFGHVNPDTHEVTVITDDGEVPIEIVSQGMTSLVAWVGVLLRRLYEVYGETADPTGQYALVLVDEIDAHMHPEWQQAVVGQLREIFPRVQFIATTHSPLVVGGMTPDQVVRLRRDDQGAVVRVPVTSEMTMGRADQILTSHLFGMRTTLDMETQKRMEDYKHLLAKTKRTADEEREFVELSQVLRFRIPLSLETPAERRAQALVQAVIADQLGEKQPDGQRALLAKARQLIEEVTAGSVAKS